eukprot:Mycagemm_TRINITY_DN10305_c3_g3::TRINITY_DN10305_c3_g3_i1::g.1301::m.1301 type:complete len:113 gc:universal TRINITY_DN10305_c3_g3_i1:115-453(+)
MSSSTRLTTSTGLRRVASIVAGIFLFGRSLRAARTAILAVSTLASSCSCSCTASSDAVEAGTLNTGGPLTRSVCTVIFSVALMRECCRRNRLDVSRAPANSDRLISTKPRGT